MKNERILLTLKILLNELEYRVKRFPTESHFLCHILESIGNYEKKEFLELSGLNKKWLDRGHHFFVAWHLNRDMQKEYYEYEEYGKMKNLEKIEVIKERIKELENGE